MMPAIVFGSPEAAAMLRRDRLARDLMVDNGCTADDCQDHLFIGSQSTALCGATRAPCGDEYCRPYDPAAPAFDDAGICEECLSSLTREADKGASL